MVFSKYGHKSIGVNHFLVSVNCMQITDNRHVSRMLCHARMVITKSMGPECLNQYMSCSIPNKENKISHATPSRVDTTIPLRLRSSRKFIYLSGDPQTAL